MPEPVIVPEDLRLARERQGVRQKALAEKAGINKTYLSEIENGRQPSGVIAYRLAKALGVPPETFILAERRAKAS